MKKLFIVLMMAFCANAQAQEIFNEIKHKAFDAVSNEQTLPIMKQINQFKLDALNYLAISMQEQMPDAPVLYLDEQALGLNNFITAYIMQLVKMNNMPDAAQVKIAKIFIDASVSNPLFNDKEEEPAHSYLNNASSITRFSLDTDWPRALAAVQAQLKD